MTGVCLVTGATGFIGSHVAARLTREGFRVRALVRSTSATTRLEGLDVETMVGDLTDGPSLARAAAGCSHVVHCAALVSDWAPVPEIRAVNVEGTRRLLEAAAAASVQRFVHLSSTDVYGYPGGAAVDESHVAARFRNWYAETKRQAEDEVRRAGRESGMPVVLLRPATVYGPGSTEVVGEIAQAIRGGHMMLIGGGRAVAGLCYVDNLVDAVVLALRDDAAPGEAFNVTDGLDVTWRRFADDLAAGLGASRVRWSLPYPLAAGIGTALEHGYRLLRAATPLDVPTLLSRQAVHVMGTDQSFTNDKIRAMLGWEPSVGYPGGLAATLAWLERGQRV